MCWASVDATGATACKCWLRLAESICWTNSKKVLQPTENLHIWSKEQRLFNDSWQSLKKYSFSELFHRYVSSTKGFETFNLGSAIWQTLAVICVPKLNHAKTMRSVVAHWLETLIQSVLSSSGTGKKGSNLQRSFGPPMNFFYGFGSDLYNQTSMITVGKMKRNHQLVMQCHVLLTCIFIELYNPFEVSIGPFISVNNHAK